MCRWLVWCSSEPILLSDLLLNPSNALIHQAFNGGFHPGASAKNNMSLNADGCGVGWYGHSGAAIFRSITPAWNNRNLRELAGSIASKCIFAHVRAASPASIVSEENCHPFRYGELLFQHNGHVEKFSLIRRRLMAALRDEIYEWVKGTTDSEACFALILSLIHPKTLLSGRVPPAEMQAATLGAIALLREYLTDAGVTTGYSTFNWALTDGHTVIVTRYCDRAPHVPPPSLYYAFCDEKALRTQLSSCSGCARTPGDGSHALKKPEASMPVSTKQSGKGFERVERGAFVCCSEPLTLDTEKWFFIQENTMLTYSAELGLVGDLTETAANGRIRGVASEASFSSDTTAGLQWLPCHSSCPASRSAESLQQVLSEQKAAASRAISAPLPSAHSAEATGGQPPSEEVAITRCSSLSTSDRADVKESTPVSRMCSVSTVCRLDDCDEGEPASFNGSAHLSDWGEGDALPWDATSPPPPPPPHKPEATEGETPRAGDGLPVKTVDADASDSRVTLLKLSEYNLGLFASASSAEVPSWRRRFILQALAKP